MDRFLQVEEILSASYCTAERFDVKLLAFLTECCGLCQSDATLCLRFFVKHFGAKCV